MNSSAVSIAVPLRPKIKVSCDRCGKEFSSNSSLFRHQRNSHLKNNKCRLYICDICKKHCYSKFAFRSHWRTTHGTRKSNQRRSRCPICKQNFYGSKIINHFVYEHNIELKETTHTFPDEQSFQSWKKNIESDTFYRYILKHSNHSRNKRKYGCHRSGIFRSESKGIRHLRSQGTKKIDGYCPSSIIFRKSAEGIFVRYIHTHVGHNSESDFQHLSLSPAMKEEILKKLKENVPKHTILEEIRNSCGKKIQRDHFITMKDISNIALKHNITTSRDNKDSDLTTIHCTIDELEKEANSFILFHKPRNVLNHNYQFLKYNDFVLIVMNTTQADVLKDYGNEVICVHGTYGLGDDDFNLFSLVILDDFHEGFPCCFLITNRNDAEIFEFFYKIIECQVGNLSPKVFMSDMADELYNSWVNIMGPVELRLYCSWYVDKAWRDHLKSIKNSEKRNIVYQHLKTILYELDEIKFVNSLKETVSKFQTKDYFEDFGAYFIQNYVTTAKQWAYCYRKNTVINTTNTTIERLHQKIKYLYLKGRESGRLDQSVHFLVRFIRNKLFDRLTVLYKKNLSQKLKILRKRHADCKSVEVTYETDDLESFVVTSSDSKSNKTYRVVRNATKCNCKMYCTDCQTCIHKYLCTCSDNAVEWNMCRHIHAVCQFVNDLNITTVQFIDLSEDTSSNNENNVIDYNDNDYDIITCDEIPIEEITLDESIDENPDTIGPESVKSTERAVQDEELRAIFYEILENANTKSKRADLLQVLKNFKENLLETEETCVINEVQSFTKQR